MALILKYPDPDKDSPENFEEQSVAFVKSIVENLNQNVRLETWSIELIEKNITQFRNMVAVELQNDKETINAMVKGFRIFLSKIIESNKLDVSEKTHCTDPMFLPFLQKGFERYFNSLLDMLKDAPMQEEEKFRTTIENIKKSINPENF